MILKEYLDVWLRLIEDNRVRSISNKKIMQINKIRKNKNWCKLISDTKRLKFSHRPRLLN